MAYVSKWHTVSDIGHPVFSLLLCFSVAYDFGTHFAVECVTDTAPDSPFPPG